MNFAGAINAGVSRGPCFCFPDGNDWLVFLRDDGLIFRTDRKGAKAFRKLKRPSPVLWERNEDAFQPVRMTISPTNACGQACIYCYGTPAHGFANVIDPVFCERAIEWIAENARQRGKKMEVTFHGVGEATLAWESFARCVKFCKKTANNKNVEQVLSLCTGGQLSQKQARFVAGHFDRVLISMDGPPDIQRVQRPRRDGKDSYVPAIRLGHILGEGNARIRIQAVITEATVTRMPEIVLHFAGIFKSKVGVILGDMFPLPWISEDFCRPPPAGNFLRQFKKAFDAGQSAGVNVCHPDISLASLIQGKTAELHFCLSPFNTILARYDIPGEGESPPESGVYGYYDPKDRAIRFDHEKRRLLQREIHQYSCDGCICRNACDGPSGVRGRLPENGEGQKRHCRIRIGIAKFLLRMAAKRAVDDVDLT